MPLAARHNTTSMNRAFHAEPLRIWPKVDAAQVRHVGKWSFDFEFTYSGGPSHSLSQTELGSWTEMLRQPTAGAQTAKTWDQRACCIQLMSCTYTQRFKILKSALFRVQWILFVRRKGHRIVRSLFEIFLIHLVYIISTAPPMQDRGMEWEYLLLLELFQQMKPPMTIQGDISGWTGLVSLDLRLKSTTLPLKQNNLIQWIQLLCSRMCENKIK